MEYAVDAAGDTPIMLDSREVARIDVKWFIANMYRPWNDHAFETRLLNAMLSSVNLLCIVAPKGTGKTSAIRYVLNKLEHDHPNIGRILIDVKKSFDEESFATLSNETVITTFRAHIRKLVEAELFSGPDAGLELLSWALAGAPDDTDRFDARLVADLVDHSNLAIGEFNCRAPRRTDRRKQLATKLTNGADYYRYGSKIASELRTAHVIQAAISLGKYSRVLVVFDNVDRIPVQYQATFLSVINDLHSALAGACVTAVALRKETLRFPRPNHGGEFLTTMALPNGDRYPCVLLPSNKEDHVRSILQMRHVYSFDLFKANATLTPEDQDELKDIDPIHASLVAEFLTNSIQALANGSIRTTVELYSGFGEYLTELEDTGTRKVRDILRADPDHLHTLFFLWLRQRAADFGLLFYDVIKADVDIHSAKQFARMASEHHLLLTAILNLARELPAGVAPPLHAVFERMAMLGFSDEQITRALESMSSPPPTPATIEFVDVHGKPRLTRDSSDLVALTPLGEALITDLLDKVGYVWGKALKQAGIDDDRSYFSYNKFQRMRIFLDYARQLAKHHLRLLSLLRSRKEWMQRFEGEWLERYRRDFGVGRRLQVERLLDSARAFYAPCCEGTHNPFERLLAQYTELQQKVKRGEQYANLSIKELDSIVVEGSVD
jgi:hypothetical protein